MRLLKVSVLLLFSMASALILSCAENKSIAKWHPVELKTAPVCSECHKDAKASLDHKPGFISRHGFYAGQQKGVCDSCHKESFCADCHANKEEIKPSDKFKDSPERALPHRGDYLTQHAIDGKINPASCLKCHGRKNNARCKRCHR